MANIAQTERALAHFNNLLQAADTLVTRLHTRYDTLRNRTIFSGLLRPSHPFHALEEDLQELKATLQSLHLALDNMKSASQERV